MTQQELLDKTIDFADKAHGDQMRKHSPERYIVHPIRVMETCREYTNRLPVLASAILHDVLEDTDRTADDLDLFLRELMTDEDRFLTIQLVKELTDVYVKKNYPTLNRSTRKKKELQRLSKISPFAQTIKYADIIDNTTGISESDPDFAKRYLQECYDIVSALENGNLELRKKALITIQNEVNNI